MQDRINKLLVLSYYNPWISGGGHRPVCLLEEELQRGRKVAFIYLSDSEIDNMVNYELSKNDKLILVRYNVKDEMLIPENTTARHMFNRPINVYDFVNMWKPQFIRSHNPVSEYVPILQFAVNKGIPHIYDQMDYWDDFPVKPWGDNGEKIYIDLATECTTISNWLQKNTVTNKSLKVIPNGIKQAFVNELKCEDLNEILIKSRKQEKIVLYVGAIWPSWFDWNIVEYIVNKRSEYRYIFIGPYEASKEEDDGRNVKQKVKLLSENKNVEFLGQIPHHELIPWLRKADVGIIPFVMNSLVEACSPLKCYEYLTAFLPVVSTFLPEINNFPSVSLVKNKENFLKELDYNLSRERTKEELLKIQKFISDSTWEKRLDDFDLVEIRAINSKEEALC